MAKCTSQHYIFLNNVVHLARFTIYLQIYNYLIVIGNKQSKLYIAKDNKKCLLSKGPMSLKTKVTILTVGCCGRPLKGN